MKFHPILHQLQRIFPNCQLQAKKDLLRKDERTGKKKLRLGKHLPRKWPASDTLVGRFIDCSTTQFVCENGKAAVSTNENEKEAK